jgi:iron complex outermembrane receptor protein
MKLIHALLGLSIALGGLGAAAAEVAAQEGTGALAGTLIDDRGEPVAGVTVQLTGASARSTTSDNAGAYRFAALPAGDYTVRVEALGYHEVTETVTVASGTVTLDFVLEAAPLSLAPLQVVAATRGNRLATTLPIKIDVISEDQLFRQKTLATNPTELLANLVPSYSPGRQKLTSSGESFRGRRPLFLVDGVPQSNPLRDGRRDGFTIGTEVIERVEVVFGANAIQGLGATGGIVNYVTVSPPRSGELEQQISVATTASDELEGDGFGWRANYLAGRRVGDFDVLGSFSYEHRGLQFDGDGRAIAIDNVQGDIADSNSRSVFAKVGWEPDQSQRLQLMVSDFRLEQQGGYASLEGDRASGLPATSVEGDPAGVEPLNDVTMVALDYEHSDLFGGTLAAKAYLQDFAALFGGGAFDTFQDPTLAPVGELFDQSENNSKKWGTRLTYAASKIAGTPLDLVTGFDFIRDETFQRLVHTDRNWVPVSRFLNYAPFLQLDVAVFDALSLSGGLRWELAQLDVPGFTTLAGNRADFQTIDVVGGRPSFAEPLLNIGAVVTPTDGLRFYGSFAQAFTMPDVGRVLRGITEPGTAVEDFLDLEPVLTDNVEVGGSYGTERARVGATWFQSESALGSRLVANDDGIFQVRREPTRTHGWEVTARVVPTDALALSGGYSILGGVFDGDDDGSYEADLGAADIGPNRLNVGLDADLGSFLTGRFQAFRYFDRDFHDASGALTAAFEGYSTADVSLTGRLDRTSVTLAVSNVLDEQYITYYGQAGTDRADRYFAGRGRTLTLGVETRF